MQHNRIQVAGYLAAKPELRYLPSGTKVANVRLGESYRFTSKDEKVETYTNWHRLTFYNELAERVLAYEKGDNVFAEGSLQQRQFTPADGSKRTIAEIVVKHCHLVAASRGANVAQPTTKQSEDETGNSNDVFGHNWPL